MEETLAKPLEEQYAIAEAHYVELNERMAELQKTYFTDIWATTAVTADVLPKWGGGSAHSMSGATRDNSYFFGVVRVHPTDVDFTTYFDEVAEDWRAKGWEVTLHEPFIRYSSVSAITPDGYYFLAEESLGRFALAGYSPDYWGNYEQLYDAVLERRNAESAAQVHGDTFKPDEDKFIRSLPGVYFPFPAWDAVPEGTDTPG